MVKLKPMNKTSQMMHLLTPISKVIKYPLLC
jgi:hypothetical protein